jgi:hypothetical protein
MKLLVIKVFICILINCQVGRVVAEQVSGIVDFDDYMRADKRSAILHSPNAVMLANIKIDNNKSAASIEDKIGILEIQYLGGYIFNRPMQIVHDPYNIKNNVARFSLIKPNCCDAKRARVSLNAYKLDNLKKLKVGVSIFLPKSVAVVKEFPGAMNFLTVSEWWNNNGWNSDFPFRISVNIVKATQNIGSPLVFQVRAQIKRAELAKSWQGNIWEEKSVDFEIPFDKWFRIQYEFVEGNEQRGRFIMTAYVNGVKTNIFNIHGWTHHPDSHHPDGLTNANPVKLYANHQLIDFMEAKGSTLELLWDNLVFTTPTATR